MFNYIIGYRLINFFIRNILLLWIGYRIIMIKITNTTKLYQELQQIRFIIYMFFVTKFIVVHGTE